MTQRSSEISFYVDGMIVEAIATSPELIKKAGVGGVLDSLIKSIKDYVDEKIDPNDKVGSIINLLAPGKIFATFSMLGHPWLGALIGLAVSVFDIDVASILRKIYHGVRSLISDDGKTTPSEVDSVVSSAVASEYKPATAEEEETASQKMLLGRISVAQDMRDARIVKLAMEHYQNGMTKEAGLWGLKIFSALKGKIFKILKFVFSWIWKAFLAAAGFMVTGDTVRGLQGKKPAPPGSGGWFSGKKEPSVSIHVSRQKIFPINPSYSDVTYNHDDDMTWSESYPNTKDGIRTMLIQFAKDVYQGLDGLENIIASTAGFRVIADRIYWYNYSTAGSKMVFIPRMFKTKKQIVDMFIDDVAEKAPKPVK